MFITIHYKNNTHQLEASEDDTILDIKEKVYSSFEKIKVNKQILYFNNIEIINGNLIDNNIIDGSKITLKKKTTIKNKCHYPDCSNKAIILVGDCKWCLGSFCHQHRLPEEHKCINLSDCKQKSFDINANLVNSMKCVANKV